MTAGQLILKRSELGCEGASWSAAFISSATRRRGPELGSGLSPMAAATTAPRRTATSQRAMRQWRHSRRAGGGSSRLRLWARRLPACIWPRSSFSQPRQAACHPCRLPYCRSSAQAQGRLRMPRSMWQVLLVSFRFLKRSDALSGMGGGVPATDQGWLRRQCAEHEAASEDPANRQSKQTRNLSIGHDLALPRISRTTGLIVQRMQQKK
jgi:hypothetical protein